MDIYYLRNSLHGQISVRWERKDNKFILNVTIPANTTGTIWVPVRSDSQVTESGRKSADQQGVNFLRSQGNYQIYNIDSGSYSFEPQF